MWPSIRCSRMSCGSLDASILPLTWKLRTPLSISVTATEAFSPFALIEHLVLAHATGQRGGRGRSDRPASAERPGQPDQRRPVLRPKARLARARGCAALVGLVGATATTSGDERDEAATARTSDSAVAANAAYRSSRRGTC